MRYELTDYEWVAIKPFLPNKPRGVQRANDRRVLNGIFWVLRSGAPWRDLPGNFGQGNKNALKYGHHTADAIARRRSIATLIRTGKKLTARDIHDGS
jgi:transposase